MVTNIAVFDDKFYSIFQYPSVEIAEEQVNFYRNCGYRAVIFENVLSAKQSLEAVGRIFDNCGSFIR